MQFVVDVASVAYTQLDVCRTYTRQQCRERKEQAASALIHYWWVISNVDLRFELIHLFLFWRAECTLGPSIKDCDNQRQKSNFQTNNFSCGTSSLKSKVTGSPSCSFARQVAISISLSFLNGNGWNLISSTLWKHIRTCKISALYLLYFHSYETFSGNY